MPGYNESSASQEEGVQGPLFSIPDCLEIVRKQFQCYLEQEFGVGVLNSCENNLHTAMEQFFGYMDDAKRVFKKVDSYRIVKNCRCDEMDSLDRDEFCGAVETACVMRNEQALSTLLAMNDIQDVKPVLSKSKTFYELLFCNFHSGQYMFLPDLDDLNFPSGSRRSVLNLLLEDGRFDPNEHFWFDPSLWFDPSPTNRKMSSLAVAIYFQDEEAATMLARHHRVCVNSSVQNDDEPGEHILHLCISSDTMAPIVSEILNRSDVQVNTRYHGCTPLIYAIRHDAPHTVFDVLLDDPRTDVDIHAALVECHKCGNFSEFRAIMRHPRIRTEIEQANAQKVTTYILQGELIMGEHLHSEEMAIDALKEILEFEKRYVVNVDAIKSSMMFLHLRSKPGLPCEQITEIAKYLPSSMFFPFREAQWCNMFKQNLEDWTDEHNEHLDNLWTEVLDELEEYETLLASLRDGKYEILFKEKDNPRGQDESEYSSGE